MADKRTPTLKNGTPLYPYPIEIVRKLETKTTRAGMSRPYLARRTDTPDPQSSQVVIKIADVDQEYGDFINTALQREEQILHSLNHPNIVKLLAIPAPPGSSVSTQSIYSARLDIPGKPWFIMLEFVEGLSLRDNWDTYVMRTLPPRDRLLLLHDIASALEMIHALGWAHLDIKPENILLRNVPAGGRKMQPVLIDFGIADRIGELPDAEAGTIAYMAPERLRPDQPIRAEMDTWALGVIFYQMLTGQHPFAQNGALPPDDDTLAWARRLETYQLLPPSAVATFSDSPVINRKVDALVMRMLARNPDEREPIRAVSSQMWDLRQTWPTEPVTPPSTLWPPPRSSLLRVASAVTGILLLAMLVWGIISLVLSTPAQPEPPVAAPATAAGAAPVEPAVLALATPTVPLPTVTPLPTATAMPTLPPVTPGAPFGFDSGQTALFMPGNSDPAFGTLVAPFLIMDAEVTNEQYKSCMDAGACTLPKFANREVWVSSDDFDADYAAHPVTGVEAAQAADYATWTGGRMPTDAEWQWACSGGDELRFYPWGGSPRVAGSDESPANVDGDGTVLVAQYAPPGIPFALHDIIGNVWEWTAASDGSTYRLRGGGWNTQELDARCNYAVAAGNGTLAAGVPLTGTNAIEAGEVGFRVVWSYDPKRVMTEATPTPAPTPTQVYVVVPTRDPCPPGAKCLTIPAPPEGVRWLNPTCVAVAASSSGGTVITTWPDLGYGSQDLKLVNVFLLSLDNIEDDVAAADPNEDSGNQRLLRFNGAPSGTKFYVQLRNGLPTAQRVEVRLEGFEFVNCQ
jgi:serine/threonine protein kinase/formylglycine-generating enzyme required for sulfatase activity